MAQIRENRRDDDLYRLRHSLSHVMAQAVQKLYPGTLLGFGPPIDDGFYYDYLLPEDVSLSETDLPRVEQEMRSILRQGQTFCREDLDAESALERLRRMEEPHKLEYAQELIARGHDSLSFYTNGPFTDLCEGPHVANTRDLPAAAFKLYNVAGAYWRGDESNVMMTRVYGWAFRTQQELAAHARAVKEAKERDHRKLGRELDLFAFSEEVGAGLPLWLPDGAAIRGELEKLAYEMEFKAGYRCVAAPHVARAKLFYTSGHLPLYQDDMYPPMRLEDADRHEEYYLKPMNCPHHHMIFAARKRSYRDLPLRLSEYGSVYRFERSGLLQGLARVRGMTQNDAHIYVTKEQVREEFAAVMELHRSYYALFGMEDYYIRLSKWDPEDPKRKNKYFDDPEAWSWSQRAVRDVLDEMGLDYVESEGEAAFYGPKADIQYRTVTGKEYSIATNQLDFAQPSRFGLRYVDRDGREKTPYCIHRAPLGTHERFIAFLIEHYGGAFPTWLAPVQVRVLPIGERHVDYARRIEARLRDRLIRAEVDAGDETVRKKVRNGVTRKIPILLIVGEREREESTVTLRRYGVREQQVLGLEAFVATVEEEVRERCHVVAAPG